MLEHPGVTSLIVGGLNFEHFQANWQTALGARRNGFVEQKDLAVQRATPPERNP